MVEIIKHFGALAIVFLLVIFVCIFILAEPRSEISFWGIKFKKQWSRKINFYGFRPLPKQIPANWGKVYQVFVNYDSSRVSESIIYEELGAIHGLTALAAKQICIEMKKYGLLERAMGNYILTERGLKKLNQSVAE
ncbi:MAG: hypothetical protein B7X54_07595 [Idiomarina sp. 34-48-12]|nr:MAG: hypothetical protein B7X54_07595 [Idiomarina sp. 34-48-12]